jgi:hypothetical protein
MKPATRLALAIAALLTASICFAETSSTMGDKNSAANTKVNVVELTETFYKLKFDPETNSYQRQAITEAKPGDLIELVIRAENQSDVILKNTELINFVPEGPVNVLLDSIVMDNEAGQYRVSRDGKTYFPTDAQINSDDINFIQWVIYSMQPGDIQELTYRIAIDR